MEQILILESDEFLMLNVTAVSSLHVKYLYKSSGCSVNEM